MEEEDQEDGEEIEEEEVVILEDGVIIKVDMVEDVQEDGVCFIMW